MSEDRIGKSLLPELRKNAACAPARPKGLWFFSELDRQAQETAIRAERDNPNRFDWDDAEFLTEDFREQLTMRGFCSVEVYWSLGYCQGDGVAFYGRVYPESLREKDSKAKKLIDALAAAGVSLFVEITSKSGHYHHWNSMTVEIEFENGIDEDELPARLKIALPALREELEEHLDKTVKEISHELERCGYAEIEYRYSEDTIREELKSGERLYDKDGNLEMSETEFDEWKKANDSTGERRFEANAAERAAAAIR